MSILGKIKQKVLHLKTRTDYKNMLAEIESYGQIEGWLTDNEAYGLYATARRLPPGSKIVEIGSWQGKSTYCLAKGLRNGEVFAIDPFDASGEPSSEATYQQLKGNKPLFEKFQDNMQRLGVSEKVVALAGYSNQFVGVVSNIDFLFIDGDHSVEGCAYDFTNFSPLLKKGGYLAFHDYFPNRPDLGPTWVITQQVLPSGDYEFIGCFDSLWVARKKA